MMVPAVQLKLMVVQRFGKVCPQTLPFAEQGSGSTVAPAATLHLTAKGVTML